MSKSVLVVEDEPFIADALTYILEKDGYSTSVYSDGAGCFDHISATTPDLIILDMMLPNVSGMEILENIRADESIQKTPVLVLTAKGQRKDRQTAEDAGASMFMTKPFANQDILNNVKALLRL